MIEKELLTVCCAHGCDKIRIDDDKNLWLSRENDRVQYDELMNQFAERISHGLCPEDYEVAMKEAREYNPSKK